MSISPNRSEDVPGSSPGNSPDKEQAHRKFSLIHWLERPSQPYIVASMAIVAVRRGFYLFTDKLINLSHYPAINAPLSLFTGILLSGSSELSITFAGRRHKLYKQQLFTARLALASATPKQKPMWEIEVERLSDQVRANLWAMRISMGMSLLAAASYLIDSTGTAGFLAFLVASALAGYVLYLMYYHGVQTDEIKEDTAGRMAESIRDELNVIRLEEMGRLREALRTTSVNPSGRLAIIASGLSIPDQRQVIPILRLLLRIEEPADQVSETATWLSTRDLALHKGADMATRKADDVMRKYRRRLSSNADHFPQQIRLDPIRGWLIEPTFAQEFFNLPSQSGSFIGSDQSLEIPGRIVNDEGPPQQPEE